MQAPIISASILSANFAHLGRDVKLALEAGIDQIHFDVMDHHFVPNLTFGATVCQALRQDGITAPIDVHLMVQHPEDYIAPFGSAGANMLIFHPETVTNVQATIAAIQKAGMQAGLAFNPDVAVNIDSDILRSLDMILLMSVFPGFGGQSFIESVFAKITATRHLLDQNHSHARLGVDGGIKLNNIGSVAQAGADFFVVGSGFFHAHDYQAQVQKLKKEIEKA